MCEKGEKERVCKGYGFVTYSLDSDAERAIEHFKKAKFMNKRLVVDYAKPRERGARADGFAEDVNAQPDEVKPIAVEKERPKPTPKPKPEPKPKRPREVKPKKEKNVKRWRLIVRNLGWKVRRSNSTPPLV